MTRSLLRDVAFGLVAGLVVRTSVRFCAALRAGICGIAKVHAFGGAPEAFKIVILARALAENVHDKIAVIEQDPFGARFAFAMGHLAALASELFFDGFADGLN